MVAEEMRQDKPARIEGTHYGCAEYGRFGLLFDGEDRETKLAAQLALKHLRNGATDELRRFRVMGSRTQVEAYFAQLRRRGVKYVFLPAPSMDGVRFDPEGAA